MAEDAIDPGGGAFLIDFIGDVVCPWCYLGWARLRSVVKADTALGSQVVWRPYQLQFDIPPDGLPYADFMAGLFPDAERRRQVDEHLHGLGVEAGLDFRFDAIARRPNTNAAHRVIRWVGPRGGEVAEAIMRAHFTEGRDVGNLETLAAIAGEQGMDAGATLERLQSGEDVMAVDQECRSASRAGIGGVPFMVFGSRVALSGAEPPERIRFAIDKALELGGQPS